MPRDFLERFPRKPIPELTMDPVFGDAPLEETQLAPKTTGVEDQTALIEGAARADFTELYRRIKIAQEEDPTFCPPAMLQRVEEAERLARENSVLLNLPENDDRNPLGFITQKTFHLRSTVRELVRKLRTGSSQPVELSMEAKAKKMQKLDELKQEKRDILAWNDTTSRERDLIARIDAQIAGLENELGLPLTVEIETKK